MNILLFEKNEIHSEAVGLLSSQGHKVLDAEAQSYDSQLIEAVCIRTYTQVTPKFLDQFPNLKYVIRAGVGTDNIDGVECVKRGIKIFNSPGANAHSVAELALVFTIFLMRKVGNHIDSMKNGSWRQRQFLGTEVANKTIGIIGCGAVGKLVAKKLQGFDITRILGYDPFLSSEKLAAANIVKTDLAELLSKSDAVILSIPLTPETHNLITTDEIKMMKNTSYIINVSRGGIVNEDDLVFALQNNLIAGAALDVFENEPHHINQALLHCPNLLATPHIGGFTVEGDKAICTAAVTNFLKFLSN